MAIEPGTKPGPCEITSTSGSGGMEELYRAIKMKTLLMMILLGGASLLGNRGYARPMQSDPLEIRFSKIQNDIYVAYRPETLRYWVEGNVTIIINDSDVVVVDGSGAPASAKRVIARIRKLTSNPVRYVINTHGHGDHTIGNQEYVRAFPGVEIIAHQGTREYVTGSGYDYVEDIAASTASRKKEGEAEIARLQAEGQAGNKPVIENLIQYYRHDIDVRQKEYKGVTRTPPTLIVNDRLRLYRGDRIIDILHIGKGNTASDLIVYLPKEGIVCTGDMVTEPIPFGFSRYPIEWLESLKRLSQLEFSTLIPGHGDVQKGKAYLQNMIDLFQSVEDQVRAGITAGKDLEHIRRDLSIGVFTETFSGQDSVTRYYFDEYYATPAVERVFLELQNH